jgi:hypothetical protein
MPLRDFESGRVTTLGLAVDDERIDLKTDPRRALRKGHKKRATSVLSQAVTDENAPRRVFRLSRKALDSRGMPSARRHFAPRPRVPERHIPS